MSGGVRRGAEAAFNYASVHINDNHILSFHFIILYA